MAGFSDPKIIVASGLAAFAIPSAGGTPCAAGLLIPVPFGANAPGGCNIHPTAAGQKLLAGAIEAALASA